MVIKVVACLAVGVVSIELIRWLRKPRRAPPLVHGFPLFGCAISYFLDPVGFLRRLKRNHGNIFAFNLAGRNIVLLADDKAISSYYKSEEAVLNADAAFKSFGFRRSEIQEVIPDISRRLLREKIQKNITYFINTFSLAFEARLKDISLQGKAEDFFFTIGNLVGEAMLLTYMGDMVDLATFQRKTIALQRAKRQAISKTILLPDFLTRHSWRHVDELQQELLDFIAEALDGPLKRAKQRAIDEGPELESTSYIDFTVDFLLEENALDSMSTRQLADTLLTVLNGAYTNPGVGAAQALCFISQDPILRCKLVEEVTEAGRSIYNSKSLNGLATLDGVVRETLRLCAHPMGSMRQVLAADGWEVVDSSTGKQFHVPFGWFVGIPHNLKTMDPQVFPNPSTFDSTHFTKQLAEKRSPYAWIPFSGGRHMCPGRNVGMYAMKAAIAIWLQHMPTYKVDGDLPPLKHVGGTLAQRQSGVKVSWTV